MKSAIAFVFTALAVSSVLGAQSKGEVGCGVCNVVVRAIDDFIKYEEPTMENVLEKVCRDLPIDYLQNACENFVRSDFENIINGLVDEQLSPHEVCVVYLHECSAKRISKRSVKTVEKSQSKSAVECNLCTFVVQEIDKLILTEEPTIENVLDGVCNKLPGFLKEQCTSFVHNDFDNIITGLVHEQLSPEQVCRKYLNACSSKKAAVKKLPVPKSDFGCGVCNTVVSAIDDFIVGEEPTIEGLLDGVCNKLPGAFLQNACSNFVHQDFENIVNGLVHEQLSPPQVCKKYLHAC